MENKEGAEAPTFNMHSKDRELIINEFNSSGKIWEILPAKFDCDQVTGNCLSCNDGETNITLCTEGDFVMLMHKTGDPQQYTPYEILVEILNTDPIPWLMNEGWISTASVTENLYSQQNVMVSYFNSPIANTFPSKEMTVREVYDIIRGDKLKKVTSELRKIKELDREIEALDEKKYKSEKSKRLPYVTYGGTFKKRADEQLKQASGNMCFDIDRVDHPATTKKVLREDTNLGIVILVTSPGGDGVKLVIRSPDAASYKEAYENVRNYLKIKHGIVTDATQDISRACFLCHDPEAYYNEFAPPTRLPITTLPISVEPLSRFDSNNASKKTDGTTLESVDHSNEPDINIATLFQQQIEFTNKKSQYVEHNRNNYIHLLVSNCNRAGIPQESTSELTFLYFNLPEREMRATIQSVYRNQSHEFGKFAKSAKSAKLQPQIQPESEDENPIEDYLKTTPTIPDSVYEKIPSLFKEGARAFTDERKRDVFFTAAIAILSGCVPNVTGVYFQERVYPHLNTLIIAPAASGKGVLKNAKRLGDKYHQKILNDSVEAQKKYENEVAIFKQLERKLKKGEPCPEKPNAPAFKILFIPADSSKAKMLAHLKANDGMGIICESEADTMSGTNKQDWGDYSTILRAAFHHETISISRKGENQYDEIPEPRLAVTMTGTPGQVPRLISSAEDGLFSRILYYAYKNEIKWQDPSPKSNGLVFNDHFDALSVQVMDLISFLELSTTNVELTVGQWERINTEFPIMLSDVVTFTSEDAAGVVYRLGLILFRLCLIFTALRKFENGDMSTTVLCTDEDFETILQIIQTYLAHSLLMFTNLPKQNDSMHFRAGDSKRKFFDSLPTEFTRKEAIERSKKFMLSVRTVDAILKFATGVSLNKVMAGHYRKI